jgi:hypothetical protein
MRSSRFNKAAFGRDGTYLSKSRAGDARLLTNCYAENFSKIAKIKFEKLPLIPDAILHQFNWGKNMKKSMLALILAAVLAGAGSASAATVNNLIQGNSCFNTTPGVTLNYSQWGPYNSSTTTAVTVNCPVTLQSQNYTSLYLLVEGWSRNSSNLLSCTVNATGPDGYNRTNATASVPFNTTSGNVATTTAYPSWQNVWTYITCNIPPANTQGTSYLSTIYLSGTY